MRVFESSPETATFERLFLVLRTLDVDISLSHSDTQQAGVARNTKATW